MEEPTPTRPQETPIAVTKNRLSALRYLRRSREHRPLWADAICINQHDLAERSTQVALMGDIYQTANSVTVWLGDASNESDMAIDYLAVMGSDSDQHWHLTPG